MRYFKHYDMEDEKEMCTKIAPAPKPKATKKTEPSADNKTAKKVNPESITIPPAPEVMPEPVAPEATLEPATPETLPENAAAQTATETDDVPETTQTTSQNQPPAIELPKGPALDVLYKIYQSKK